MENQKVKDTKYEYLLELLDDKRNKSNYQEILINDKTLIWWECKLGHSFQSSMNNMVFKKRGFCCPNCSQKIFKKGKNDITITHKHLISEWNDKKDMSDFSRGSHYEAQWKCSKGHVYKQEIVAVSRKKTACTYCSGRRILAGFNDLATTHPELIKEWDDPKDITTESQGSMYVAQWKCSKGHSYKRSIYHRIEGYDCGICKKSTRLPMPGFNTLQDIFPETAEEWDYEKNYPLTPSDVTKSSREKVWWKCPNGHGSYYMKVNHRTSGSFSKCPKCFNARNRSYGEIEMAEYVQNEILPHHHVETSYRPQWLSGLELDVYIPHLNIGIEYNGIYWHNTSRPGVQERDEQKKRLCEINNTLLIIIWEDRWIDHKDDCKQSLRDLIVNHSA